MKNQESEKTPCKVRKIFADLNDKSLVSRIYEELAQINHLKTNKVLLTKFSSTGKYN